MKHAALHIVLPTQMAWYHRIIWAFAPKRKALNIPESWAELKPRQALRLAALHMQGKPPVDFQVNSTMVMLRLSCWHLSRIGAEGLLQNIFPAIDWAAQMKVASLPKYTWRIGFRRYLVPAPGMVDMPIQQYLWCEEEMEKIREGKADPAAFLASLLRPMAAGRHRHEHGVLPVISQPQRAAMAASMRRASPSLFWLLLHYYATQRGAIAERFPHLHTKKEGASAPQKTDWQALPGIIAESGVFGSLQSTLSSPVLAYLAWANARQAPAAQDKPKTLQDIIREQHQKHLN